MIFNSFPFILFFIVFFFLYWFVFSKNVTSQNLLLLAGNYLFYSYWDWRFLSLLIGNSLLNYVLGIYIRKTNSEKRQKTLLLIGLIIGVGCLVVFKYLNFFIDSFISLFDNFNIHINLQTINIILPLGISFYTFRTISYLLDVYKGKIEPEKNWLVFFAFVSYFPSLLAGPIDSAKKLIPQLTSKRIFNYNESTDGLRQILWGLFKKIVVADNCAVFANQFFNDYENMPAINLLLGTFFFTMQIYADFSGYSDMAIGFSRLIGFEITKNFDFPFFSQNIAEFWRKWHISLTSWLTEYIFTPLSIKFRDYDQRGLILAILINFTIIGIWHGANWTFVLFGVLHGCYYIPLILRGTMNKKSKMSKTKLLPTFREAFNMIGTFMLVLLANIIFKADNISQAFNYISRIFSKSILNFSEIPPQSYLTIIIIAVFIILEWLNRDKNYAIEKIGLNSNKAVRWGFLSFLIFSIGMFMATDETTFIYFNF